MSDFDSNIIKNPEIFEQNRLAAHSDHVCYKNELEKIKGKSSLRYDMNGLWKFAYAKNQSLAPCGFEAADYDCKGWDEIRVPAHIQMEGYDVPIYTNTTYPWEADESMPGEVPEIFNPVASYVKYFTIPENMQNKTGVYFVPGSGERFCTLAEWTVMSATVRTHLLRLISS